MPTYRFFNSKTKTEFEEYMTISDMEKFTKKKHIELAIANVEIAEADIKLAKGNLLPSLLGFYSFSTRLSYADRIRGSGEFQEIPIGFVRSSGEVVNTNRE